MKTIFCLALTVLVLSLFLAPALGQYLGGLGPAGLGPAGIGYGAASEYGAGQFAESSSSSSKKTESSQQHHAASGGYSAGQAMGGVGLMG